MKYDAIIIGSGQAGNPLSDSLTDQGWTVALIETSPPGRDVHQHRLHADEDHGGLSPDRALHPKRRSLGRA